MRDFDNTFITGNLAYNRPAKQSSEYDISKNYAGRAVDGSTTSDWTKCTHTKAVTETLSWWYVELAAMSVIQSVTLYNRGGSGE